MKYGHNLKFKDARDISFANNEIKKFIDETIYSKVEITKDNIYLYRRNETGFEHFTFYGFTPSTSKEMLIYITALNNSNFTKNIYKG